MSATTRKKSEVANDYYRTPTWCVEAIRAHIPPRLPSGPQVEAEICDPCAGDGAILEGFCEVSVRGDESELVADHPLRALELDAALAARIEPSAYHRATTRPTTVTVRDALSDEAWGCTGHVVMNPPYSSAEKFVRRALVEVAPHGGCVFALLRLGFLESVGRVDLHGEYPAHVYVLPARPSFCLSVRCRDRRGCGYRAQLPPNDKAPQECPSCRGRLAMSRTDATAYAWFAWATRPNVIRPGLTILEAPVHLSVVEQRVDLGRGIAVHVPLSFADGSKISEDAAGTIAASAVGGDPALLAHLQNRIDCGARGEALSRIYAPQFRRLVASALEQGAGKPAKKARRRSA